MRIQDTGQQLIAYVAAPGSAAAAAFRRLAARSRKQSLADHVASLKERGAWLRA